MQPLIEAKESENRGKLTEGDSKGDFRTKRPGYAVKSGGGNDNQKITGKKGLDFVNLKITLHIHNDKVDPI